MAEPLPAVADSCRKIGAGGDSLNLALVVAALTIVLLPFNAQAQTWQQGFDFRHTASFVTDPPESTYVLATTA